MTFRCSKRRTTSTTVWSEPFVEEETSLSEGGADAAAGDKKELRRLGECGVVGLLEPVAELSFIHTLQSETEERDAGAMTGKTVGQS